MRGVVFEIEGISADRAAEKLRRGGIEILSAKKTQKNAVAIAVDGKERKKVFAILRDSCYNIKKVRRIGWEKLRFLLLDGIGLVAGAALALSLAAFAESRVLRVEVEGSGKYLEREIHDVLSKNGVSFFSPSPSDRSAISAQVLSLPRVCFCSLDMKGGVLTVRVETEDGISPAKAPLLAPVSGVVEELLVLRGTPLVSVGDEAEAGAPVVGDYALIGGEVRPVAVMARVRISFPVHRLYELNEAGARAQAELDFGQIENLTLTPAEGGYLVEGRGHADASLNFR